MVLVASWAFLFVAGFWVSVGGMAVLPAEAAATAAEETFPVPSIDAAKKTEMLLAKVWQHGRDPAAFWVSEKLDGVRAIWDGHQLRFRSGRIVPAPDWFTAVLPAQPLDGELWLGRGAFDALSAIVRKTPPVDAEWRQVRYMIFELPELSGVPGASGSFTQRVEQMRVVVDQAKIPWLQGVPQFRVANAAQLMARYREVIAGGGEGLMLHRADALYHTGRSDDLLKLKPAEDAEAVVIGYLPGKGRYTGMVGALLVENAEGKRFRIGSGLDEATRRHPPAVGATITYRYQQLSVNGIPRFPRYWRVRDAL
ncbi:DNA ligase [Rugosibacter aromaticivorans]|uniref:DNA ligase n=2 Tax=Rugosibacter aromaticivorans TaxID=1565605 RepID=A0A0C5IZG2_9PROT|nr:DNA ligase [Rugosibacter aromaticivorans]